MPSDWVEVEKVVATTRVKVRRKGEGPPLVVLHHDFGTPPDLPFYDLLAQSFDVVVPEHPGFGESERPVWMRSVRDLAALYRALLNELEVERPILVGLGFGGWVAAEMATMGAGDVERLVLVGSMGIRPNEGFILDQALVGYMDYAQAAFEDPARFDAVYGAQPSNDQLELWDICREMCFRIAWKPYMYSVSLPFLLSSLPVRTLLVWGREDKIVPVSTAAQFEEALPDATLSVIDNCGHAVDMEQPEALDGLIRNFCTG
jgi:pimeloyl-ACP methyl ester carboxylesterase